MSNGTTSKVKKLICVLLKFIVDGIYTYYKGFSWNMNNDALHRRWKGTMINKLKVRYIIKGDNLRLAQGIVALNFSYIVTKASFSLYLLLFYG